MNFPYNSDESRRLFLGYGSELFCCHLFFHLNPLPLLCAMQVVKETDGNAGVRHWEWVIVRLRRWLSGELDLQA